MRVGEGFPVEVLFALEPSAHLVTSGGGTVARRHSTGQAGVRHQGCREVLPASETLSQAWIWGRRLLNPGEDSDHQLHFTDGGSESVLTHFPKGVPSGRAGTQTRVPCRYATPGYCK